MPTGRLSNGTMTILIKEIKVANGDMNYYRALITNLVLWAELASSPGYYYQQGIDLIPNRDNAFLKPSFNPYIVLTVVENDVCTVLIEYLSVTQNVSALTRPKPDVTYSLTLDEEPVQLSVMDALDAPVHPEGLPVSQSKIIAIPAIKLKRPSRWQPAHFFFNVFFTSPNVNP
jgi:hypothetical protein